MSAKKKKIINGYEFVNILGQGSFGKVHKAIEIKTGKEVAIKSMDIEMTEKRKIAEKEEENYKLLKGSSPYLVNLLDSFEEDDVKYFVLELCENSNLNSLIETFKKIDLPLHEEKIWKILAQFLLALGTLESFNMIHRDIKGENVFINKENVLKLGDFGLSRELSFDSGKASTMVGTMVFMAPEVISGIKYNASSDIWSTGIVMYQLMEFNLPFDASSGLELQKIIATKPHPPLSKKYSSVLRGVVDKMLEKDPSKRISLRALLLLPEVRRCIIENSYVVPPLYQKLYDSTPLLEEDSHVVTSPNSSPSASKTPVDFFGGASSSISSPGGSPAEKKSKGSSSSPDIPITFIDNPRVKKDGGLIIDKHNVIFTKGVPFSGGSAVRFTLFLDKEVKEGIWRLDVVGAKPSPDGKKPQFKIGIATKDVIQKVSTDWFDSYDSTCCIHGRSDDTRIRTGKTSHPDLMHPSPSGILFGLEVDNNTGVIRFLMGNMVVGMVVDVPKGVYFGVSNDFVPVRYEITSLRKLNKPTIDRDKEIPSFKWEG